MACKKLRLAPTPRFVAVSATVMLVLCQYASTQAQIASGKQQVSGKNQLSAMQESESEPMSQQENDAELQTGTVLTHKGLFSDAIPHLLAARAGTPREYAVNFNLALCYVGTSQFKLAIEVLSSLRGGHNRGDIENLLAQAYIGNAQPKEAWAALQKAAVLSPQNEKLYVFVADACMEHHDYDLGLRVVDIGLHNVPLSARLHYERAMFLSQLDEPDQAKQDFKLAGALAPGTEIGYLAASQKELFEGEISEAIRSAREGEKQGFGNPVLLTILGEALIRSGVSPGQPEFGEAQTALERAVSQRSNDPASQIALGGLYLMTGRLRDAISHLETARQLDPGKPSVYAYLAKAYQRQGDAQQAQEALATLEKLNREQADRISSATGDRRLGYANGAGLQGQSATPHP